MIRDAAPGASVLHAAYFADVLGDRYPELATVPPLEALVGTRWAPPALGWEQRGPALVDGADLVISQGGGFLREGYGPWGRLDALGRVVDGGRPLAIVGQTIDRFDSTLGRRLARRVLGAAALVVVRDPASVDHVVDLGVPAARVQLGTDLALDLVDRVGRAAPATDAGIDVVLSDHTVSGDRRGRAALAAAVLTAIGSRHPDRLITVWSSAQHVPGVPGDEAVCAEALRRAPAEVRARVTVVDGHVDAHGLLERVARSAAMCSMRMHPGLLAAAVGVPTVLVLDDIKVGVLHGTPMARHVVRDGGDAAPGRAASLLDPAAVTTPWSQLAPVRDRLEATRSALSALVASSSSPGRAPTSGSGALAP